MEKYYILEGAQWKLDEEEYIALKKEEYKNSIDSAKGVEGAELVSFDEFLDEPDYELKYVLEIGDETFEDIEYLYEINYIPSRIEKSGLGEFYGYIKLMGDNDHDYKTAIEDECWAYQLTNDLWINITFEIDEIDEEDISETKIKNIGYEFI